MKKVVSLFILFFVVQSAFAGWVSHNDFDMLRTGNKSIKNFVVSEDGKYIYTLNDSALITKWDFATGDSISAIKIKPIPGTDTPAPYYSLSSDAKTYVIAKYEFGSTDIKTNAYIYDLNTNVLIDSLSYIHHDIRPEYQGSMTETFKIIKYDYYSNKKLMLFLNQYDLTNYWRYYDVRHSGAIHLIKRADTNWVIKKKINGTPLLVSYNNDNLLFYSYHYYSARTDMHSGIGSSYKENANQIYNTEKNAITSISYYYMQRSGGEKEEGYSFPVSSIIFMNKSLYLLHKNLLKIYDIDSLKITRNITYSEYIEKNPKLELNLNSNVYIISCENTINLHNTKNHKRHYQIEINSASNLVHFRKNNRVRFLFFSDTGGNLYRIPYDSLFKLHANFITQDTLFTAGDTVKFTNLSLGEPTEYHWDFGDGSTSTEKNPIHIYSDTGSFSIKLIVKKVDKTDSIIKTKYIYVLPNVKVDFDYTISEGRPVTVVFRNTTKAVYDSLKWKFEDNKISKRDSVQRKYEIQGTYPAKLTLYRLSKQYTKEKELKINIKEILLDREKLIYEFTDTNYKNYIAYRAYDDNQDNFIYHIKGKDSYYGLYKSRKPVWSAKNENINNYIFRRAENTYTFIDDSVIYNFDMHNSKTNKYDNFKNKIIYWGTNGDDIFSLFITRYCPKVKVYNKHNEVEKELEVGFSYDYILETYCVAIDYNNNHLDYILYFLNYFVDDKVHKDIVTRLNDKIINNVCAKRLKKLNDSIIVIMQPSNILIFKQKQKRIDSIYKSNLTNYKFSDITKLNNNLFVVVGNYKKHPAFIVFDKAGNIIRETILNERFGAFISASVSADSTFLLAGWRYKNYPIKNPYFLKIRYLDKKYPPIEPEFKYNIVKKLNTTDVVFQNTTKENCDSLHWELYVNNKWILLNKDSVYANKLTLTTIFDTSYTIKMTTYKWGNSFATAENIKIKAPNYKNNSANIISEFTDTNYSNYEAVSAYDDLDKNLRYLVKGVFNNKANSFIGMYEPEHKDLRFLWEPFNSYLFRRTNNEYLFTPCLYDLNKISILQFNFSISYVNLCNIVSSSTSRLSNYDKYLAVIPKPNEFGSGYCTYFLYDNKNKLVQKDSLKVPAGIKYLHNVSVISTGDYVDNLISCNIGDKDVSYLNGSEIPYTNFIQFIRLNTKILIALDSSKISIYGSNGQLKLIISKKFSDWTFTHISKLSDSLYVIAGSKGVHPAYIIMDKSLNVFYEEVFSPIYGRFNFVSKSPDNNLLFAGYRYTDSQTKYPYYLKVKSYWKRIEEEKENNEIIFEHYAYPNPTDNKIKLRVMAYMSVEAKISIFDAMGNIVYEIDKARLRTGLNEFEFNFAAQAIGTYYYTIATGTEIKTGKIILMR